MSVKVGDVVRTKDKYPVKGVVYETSEFSNTASINLFSGGTCLKSFENLEILTGFQAVKPGDIIVTPIGNCATVYNVTDKTFTSKYGIATELITQCIDTCESLGWTIKGQAPNPNTQTDNHLEQIIKDHNMEITWGSKSTWYLHSELSPKLIEQMYISGNTEIRKRQLWHDMTKEEVKAHLFEKVWMWDNMETSAHKTTLNGFRNSRYMADMTSWNHASLERPY